MVDPSILDTEAFRLIEKEYTSAIREGPTYVCDICWKLEFRQNVINFNNSKYEKDIYQKCHTNKSEWICNGCHRSLLKGNIPMQGPNSTI